jgi:hypothetical protein
MYASRKRKHCKLKCKCEQSSDDANHDARYQRTGAQD